MCDELNSNEKFDFFEELFKCVGENKKIDDKVCLIGGEPLREYSVALECGHTFNYDEIFGTFINRFISQAVIVHPLTIYGQG